MPIVPLLRGSTSGGHSPAGRAGDDAFFGVHGTSEVVRAWLQISLQDAGLQGWRQLLAVSLVPLVSVHDKDQAALSKWMTIWPCRHGLFEWLGIVYCM
mmetsp:Transcript_35834/g.95630  ORF Transcript_35834/g.95630 Transcript_35834/m.95630 type:complete len:98 (+) Transcript_35834:330-623(+)